MTGSRHQASLLTSAVVLSLTLAACSSGSSTSPAGGASAKPHAGGHLTFALGSDPICVDPHQAATNDAVYAARGLVDSLTDQDSATGRIAPWLATSWEVSPDASAFTFHLRDGATFSDGTPVDAQSVKANFDAVVKLGAKSIFGSGYLSGYRSTEVIDAHTAKVTFDHPNAQFLQATSTTTLGLLAPASLKRSAESLCAGPLTGSGPFTLDSYTPGRSVELSRRANYTGAPPCGDTPAPRTSTRSPSRSSRSPECAPAVLSPDRSTPSPGSHRRTRRASPARARNCCPGRTPVCRSR